MKKIIIIGAGASGCFVAANTKNNKYDITILEKSKLPLQKVSISGGGRCNVTNACFNVKKLSKNYPRGSKNLLAIFNKFQPSNIFDWFEKRKVPLKIEKDNRAFPTSNSSKTIIDCFLNEIEKNRVNIHYNTCVESIKKQDDVFIIETSIKKTYIAEIVVISSGSSNDMYKIIEQLGHSIIPPVPSLFSFNSSHHILNNMQGTSFPNSELSINSLKLKERGSFIITHWGISGPSVLRLSAWGARELAKIKYKFNLKINWIGEDFETIRTLLINIKNNNPNKLMHSITLEGITARFWKHILNYLNIKDKPISESTKSDINKIAELLTNTNIEIEDKGRFKDEFVTAGGVSLKEIEFDTMQSRIVNNLYFCGEILDIDGITGGFNLQACWSEAYIISEVLNNK